MQKRTQRETIRLIPGQATAIARSGQSTGPLAGACTHYNARHAETWVSG